MIGPSSARRAASRRPSGRRLAVATALALLVAVALSGCGGELAGSADQGFVSSTGSVVVLAPDERRAPGEVAGTSLDGERVSLADHPGEVVVIPVWGSWCGPCRKEAPVLAAAARDLADDDVRFLGIDSRDENRAKALAFVRNFDIPYPSIYDPAGDSLLAFAGVLAPNSIPSVVVIDEEGRVAAVVRGDITTTTLYDVIEEVAGTPLSPGAPGGDEDGAGTA